MTLPNNPHTVSLPSDEQSMAADVYEVFERLRASKWRAADDSMNPDRSDDNLIEEGLIAFDTTGGFKPFDNVAKTTILEAYIDTAVEPSENVGGRSEGLDNPQGQTDPTDASRYWSIKLDSLSGPQALLSEILRIGQLDHLIPPKRRSGPLKKTKQL